MVKCFSNLFLHKFHSVSELVSERLFMYILYKLPACDGIKTWPLEY